MDADILNQLAQIGHQLWSDGMRQAGWTYGESYSQDNRTHDALVDFNDLPNVDQRTARLRIESEQVCQLLATLATPDRSDTRPFVPGELHVGQHVGWAGEGQPPGEPGLIESWDVDESTGDVLTISVRWSDGTIEAIGAMEGLLRRLGH